MSENASEFEYLRLARELDISTVRSILYTHAQRIKEYEKQGKVNSLEWYGERQELDCGILHLFILEQNALLEMINNRLAVLSDITLHLAKEEFKKDGKGK